MYVSGEGFRVRVVTMLKIFADQIIGLLLIPLWKDDAMNDFDVATDDVGEFGGKW